jgi:hypothetical protein
MLRYPRSGRSDGRITSAEALQHPYLNAVRPLLPKRGAAAFTVSMTTIITIIIIIIITITIVTIIIFIIIIIITTIISITIVIIFIISTTVIIIITIKSPVVFYHTRSATATELEVALVAWAA